VTLLYDDVTLGASNGGPSAGSRHTHTCILRLTCILLLTLQGTSSGGPSAGSRHTSCHARPPDRPP